MSLTERIRFGPIVEKAPLDENLDEYRSRVYEMSEVDVEVEEIKHSSFFGPGAGNRSTTDYKEAEDLSGEEAWEFVNSTLQEMEVGIRLEEAPTTFIQRERPFWGKRGSYLSYGAQNCETLSTRNYNISIEGEV